MVTYLSVVFILLTCHFWEDNQSAIQFLQDSRFTILIHTTSKLLLANKQTNSIIFIRKRQENEKVKFGASTIYSPSIIQYF